MRRPRQNARRLYDRFPEAVEALGIRTLLDTPIRTAADVARWTDSICNASLALPEKVHRGLLPGGGGIHHYPTPVAEIALFKYDDFPLWVTDQEGNEVAVAPVASRGQGDGRVQVLDAPAGSAIAKTQQAAWRKNRPATLPSDHEVAEKAFADQYAKLATDQVDPNDPLSKTRLPGAAAPGDGGS